MLKNRVRNYYLNLDCNCAESLLLAANDEYHLNITPDDIKLIGGFGMGMGCKITCGALCSCIAVIGKRHITQRAHTTDQLAELCNACVNRFRAALGTDNCEVLRDRYFSEDIRCLNTVLKAADVLETLLKDYEKGEAP